MHCADPVRACLHSTQATPEDDMLDCSGGGRVYEEALGPLWPVDTVDADTSLGRPLALRDEAADRHETLPNLGDFS